MYEPALPLQTELELRSEDLEFGGALRDEVDVCFSNNCHVKSQLLCSSHLAANPRTFLQVSLQLSESISVWDRALYMLFIAARVAGGLALLFFMYSQTQKTWQSRHCSLDFFPGKAVDPLFVLMCCAVVSQCGFVLALLWDHRFRFARLRVALPLALVWYCVVSFALSVLLYYSNWKLGGCLKDRAFLVFTAWFLPGLLGVGLFFCIMAGYLVSNACIILISWIECCRRTRHYGALEP